MVDKFATRRTECAADEIDELLTLKQSVLDCALFILGIAIPLTSGIFMFYLAIRGELDTATIYRNLVTLLFPLLLLLKKHFTFRTLAILLLALLIATGFHLAIRGGLSAGNVIRYILALVLGALFFGRTGAIAIFSIVVCSYGVAALLLINGIVAPPDPETWNQLSPLYWFRQLIIFVVLGVALVLTHLYINERLFWLSKNAREMAKKEQQQLLAVEESRKVEALSRLAGGIAHDFNNSLTVMLGNAELVRSELREDSPAIEAIDRVIEVGMSMSKMTRQLLTIGRKRPDAAQAIDVGEFLTKLGSSLQRLLTSSHQLKIDVEGHPRIYADPGMFERAFFNLVLNARDAMPDGGTIRVHCAMGKSNGQPDTVQRVSLTIADSGIGMDEETLSQIFDPFFTTKGEAGTGLGLATLKAWLQGTGGEIQVESRPGKGTSFTLNIPAANN